MIRRLKKDLATEAPNWVDSDLIAIEQAICRIDGIDYDAIRRDSIACRVLDVRAKGRASTLLFPMFVASLLLRGVVEC